MKSKEKSILCVANWDSNVGYAWWLMESFWLAIGREFGDKYTVIVTYPSITIIPDKIKNSSIVVNELDFNRVGLMGLVENLLYISKSKVRYIYFTDKVFFHWKYALYKLFGVKKIIVHDHTPGVRTIPAGVKRKAKCVLSRLPWISADLLIGATNYIKERDRAVICIPENKCVSAPNGIPVELGVTLKKVDINKEFAIPEDRFIIASVGRANFYKGIDFSLEVIRYIVHEKKYENITYLHFGDGPDLVSFQRIAEEKRIKEYVVFAGRRDDLVDYLPYCDVGLHASRGEVGYSLSILEIMRASLPVVVPDNPSVCEATVHGETGLIYKDHDVSSAAQCLITLLCNKGLRLKMKKASFSRVREKYSLDMCHHQFINHMNKIVD